MSKSMSQFKKKIQSNRCVNSRGEIVKDTNGSYLIDVPRKNLTAKIDTNNVNVAYNEVKLIVNDIVNLGLDMRKNQVIDLYSVADVSFNLLFRGIKEDKLYFKVC